MDKVEKIYAIISKCYVELTYFKIGLLMGYYVSRTKLADGFPIELELCLSDFCKLLQLLTVDGWKVVESNHEDCVYLAK